MVRVPEGRCPKCGFEYRGWALRNPRYQACPKCGIALHIRNSNGTISKGYSPFDAERHVIDTPGKIAHTEESTNSSRKKDRDSGVKDQ